MGEHPDRAASPDDRALGDCVSDECPIGGPAGASPWLEVLKPWAEPLPRLAGGEPDLILLNEFAHRRAVVNASGRAIRFVEPAAHDDAGAARYELQIWHEGTVPTRSVGRGALHDLYNALAWIAFPAIKARLNGLQADSLRDAALAGPAPRGRLRDRVTLFDESGALFVTDDGELAAALRAFDWHTLFVRRRSAFARQVRVCLLGHALFEKLHAPYKSICAHALVVCAPAHTPLDALDQRVAAGLDERALGGLSPLPLMGVPGWWGPNEEPGFYNDESVFRRGRGQ